ncbi:metal-dependent phosphohydrolase (plasmid) [Brevibacillus halotolerans]|nr:metal-dependent phosphohydrolase [Brevibacillus halotolerans]
MSLSMMFQQIHSSPDPQSIVHISESVSSEQNGFLKEFFGDRYSHIFYSPTTMPNYHYHNGLVWIDIWGIEKEQLIVRRVLEHIQHLHKRIENWQSEKKYKDIFSFIEKKVSLLLFIQHFSIIPDEQKYDIFRYIYQRSEYNFHHLTPVFLETLFRYRKYSSDWKQDMETLNQYTDPDGKLTIYRGEESESTKLHYAWSWSLSYPTARFFATRFSEDGIVYQAKVSLNDVSDYLPKRNEQEILINSKFVHIVDKKNVSKDEIDDTF